MRLPILGLIVILLSSCSVEKTSDIDEQLHLKDILKAHSPTGDLEYYLLPQSKDFLKIPQDPMNTLTPLKVQLGKFLFHETAIGLASKSVDGMQTYSCASCHHASAGFQSGVRQGIGDGGLGFGYKGEGRLANPNMDIVDLDVQPIKSPSAMNVAYQNSLLWNGQFGSTPINKPFDYKWEAGTPLEANHLGFQGAETQAIAGMGVHRLKVNKEILDENGYLQFFDDVFADQEVAERYTVQNAAMAIAAYERTLLPNRAPWQEWLRGDPNAMNEQEIRGAILFFDKARCYQCHSGPALNDMNFYALGMGDLLGHDVFNSSAGMSAHLGRGGFTGVPSDMHKFKTPQLYNLADAGFYGHGGTFVSLRSVVEYKNKAIPQKALIDEGQLADAFTPLELTENEVSDLTAFLEHALRDPQLERYVPSSLPSGACFPNNDYLSRLDLDCN